MQTPKEFVEWLTDQITKAKNVMNSAQIDVDDAETALNAAHDQHRKLCEVKVAYLDAHTSPVKKKAVKKKKASK